MIFFLDNLCDTSRSFVNSIKSHGMHISALFIIPIVIDLCKNTVVWFEKLDAWFTLGVVGHWESVKYLIIFVYDLQPCIMDSKCCAFIVRFAIAVTVSIGNAEKIFFGGRRAIWDEIALATFGYFCFETDVFESIVIVEESLWEWQIHTSVPVVQLCYIVAAGSTEVTNWNFLPRASTPFTIVFLSLYSIAVREAPHTRWFKVSLNSSEVFLKFVPSVAFLKGNVYKDRIVFNLGVIL